MEVTEEKAESIASQIEQFREELITAGENSAEPYRKKYILFSA